MTLAEYRRFISYIYAYEGDMKTKNVGFAKIEARNGQCRMSISVKGAYECTGRELTLYGYGKKNGEFLLVPIGQIPVKNGVGEAVFGKKEDDLGGSGLGLTFLQGLFLRSGRHARKAYLTAWDDMLITISRLQQAPVVGEKNEQAQETRIKQAAKSEIPWGMREISLGTDSAEAQASEEGRSSEPADAGHETRNAEIGISGPQSLHKETGALRAAELELLKKEEQKQVSEEYVVPEHEEKKRKPDQPKEQEKEAGSSSEQIAAERLNLESYGETEAAAAAEAVVIEPEPTAEGPTIPESTAVKPASANMTAPEPLAEESAESDSAEEPAGRMPDPFYFREGLTELPLWDSLKRIMPRKRVLSEEGWEVLQIQLQDLGRLPRENWPYGNNSFVLHGYYQYRYLILARRMREQKTPGDARWQYIVGVPGIFNPQEKFMAAMFGLPEFKRADSREEGFGFWCGNVCMK